MALMFVSGSCTKHFAVRMVAAAGVSERSGWGGIALRIFRENSFSILRLVGSCLAKENMGSVRPLGATLITVTEVAKAGTFLRRPMAAPAF